MARIYISSTYIDLKKEREAAAQAVRRLGHQSIAMEDYVASDMRPVDRCLQDVKNCDAYVGILAWRYGYIPDGYDKSITHLEYEAAKNAGIPCLVFLLDKKAPWPVENVSTGEERQKIDQLRTVLKNDYNVSFFKNADELGGLVGAAVSNLTFLPRGKPQLGPIVSKMCDRILQVNDFEIFFMEKSKKCPKRPQFYFIHGDELECHESLLKRLQKTLLKKYVEEGRENENAAILPKKVYWPREGSLPYRQQYLQKRLFEEFSQSCEVTDFTANTLGYLLSVSKRPLVIIIHNIYSSKWDKFTEPLINWYIKDYWAALQCNEHDNIPLFLVFFCIIYMQAKETGLKRIFLVKKSITKDGIRVQLQHFKQFSDEKCPCQVLKELTPIEREDVMDWFSENNIIEQESEIKKRIDYIFRENNHIVKSKPMAEVEVELQKIVDEYRHKMEEMI